MDFRTEWSSWVLVLLMMVIAYFVNPWDVQSNIGVLLLQVVAWPISIIAIACIPVLIVCYFIKMIPDIDYSIRLAFVYFLFVLARHLMA